MSNRSAPGGPAVGPIAAGIVLDALGDPMRRRILECLRGGASPVGRLAEQLPIGRPAVSKHLRVLQDAGLVDHAPLGTRNLYAIAPGGAHVLQQWLVDVWDTALRSFADFVAAEQTNESTHEVRATDRSVRPKREGNGR